MKNRLFALIISIILACNTSHPMQQSVNSKQIGLLACITAGCGISLYTIHYYKHSLQNWLASFYRTLTIDTQHKPVENNNTLPQSPNSSKPSYHTQHIEPPILRHNNNSMVLPHMSIEDLQQNTQQYLQKKEVPVLIEGTTDLHIACDNNDIEAVTLLLQTPTTDINARRDSMKCYGPRSYPKQGETPLHIACQNNNKKIVQLLLACDSIDTNVQNNKSNTPLHIACQNNNEEIVDLLLACKDTNITLKNYQKESPLHIACTVGNTALNSTFLHKIFLIHNICDKQSSPHIFPQELKKQISTYCQNTIVQKLLNYDASNINAQNDTYQAAIDVAYLHNHKDIFALLVNQDNIDLANLLPLACERHDTDTIIQLLNHKNIKFDNSQSLYTACENGYDDIVNLLLPYNKNNCMDINNQRYNPLLIACEKIEKAQKPNTDYTKFATIIHALLNDPAIDINVKTNNGLTVFHFVASDCELLRLFLQKDNRFINEQENSRSGYIPNIGATPLHNAVNAGNTEAIFLLLEHGANISIKGCGRTPFALVCEKISEESDQWFGKSTYKDILVQLLQSPYITPEIINFSECLYQCLHRLDLRNPNSFVLNLLLKYGADPNKESGSFNSSPMLEVAKHNLSLLNLFIDQYNGDIYHKNNQNQTIFYIAFMSKNIKKPHEINFFNDLNIDEKSSFMERELAAITEATPKNIFMWHPYDEKKNNGNIQLFSSFIGTCLNHVKKELHTTFLETAYAHLHKRNNTFNSSSPQSSKKKCMHLEEKICLYKRDRDCYTGYSNRYDGCEDCQTYFNYNELIAHALIQHIEPTTTEQVVDKTIALTYKQEPTKYYVQTTQEKENQKAYLKEQIEKLNS